MNSYYVKDKVNFILMIMAVISVLAAAIFYFFLPEEIPMQWNGIHVNWYADRLAIFLYPVICLVIMFLLKSKIKSRFMSPIVSNLVIAGLIFIFLSCEIYTIAYCFGLRWNINFILLIEFISILIVGFIIVRHYNNK